MGRTRLFRSFGANADQASAKLGRVLQRRHHHHVDGHQEERRRQAKHQVHDPAPAAAGALAGHRHSRAPSLSWERRYGTMMNATSSSRMTPIAAPLANWLPRKGVMNMSSAGTSVQALSGPAIANTRSKIFRLM